MTQAAPFISVSTAGPARSAALRVLQLLATSWRKMVGKVLPIRTTCAMSFGIVKRVAGYVPCAGIGRDQKARRGWTELRLVGHRVSGDGPEGLA